MMSISKAYTVDTAQKWFKPTEIDSDKFFFHYTDISSALEVLKYQHENGKYIKLWVSHFLYLNDSNEFREGFDIVLKTIEENNTSYPVKAKEYFTSFLELFPSEKRLSSVQSQFLHACGKALPSFDLFYPNHFSLSFCGNGDLLSQWKWYGGKSGISIEFDLPNCEFNGNILNDDEVYSDPIWGNITYDKDADRVEIKEILNPSKIKDSADSAQGQLIEALKKISFIKNSGFEEEQESRIIFPLVYNNSFYSEPKVLNHIKYRAVEGNVRPYIEIKVRGTGGDRLPIKSLMIGPGINQDQTFNAIVSLVESYYPYEKTDYLVKEGVFTNPINDKQQIYSYIVVHGIEIRRSSIPFRG